MHASHEHEPRHPSPAVSRRVARAPTARMSIRTVSITLVLVAAALVPAGVGAQNDATVERIKTEATDGSQVMELFDYLTNAIGPRLTATPGYKRAADWAVDRLEEWGLSNVHREAFEFGRGWTLEGMTAEMTAPRYFPLIAYPEAWTPSTRGTLEGEPVYIGNWTADEVRSRASELRGRIVLPYRPMEEFITADRLQPTDHDESVRIGAPPFFRPEGPFGRRELAGAMREVGAGAVLQPTQGNHGTMFVLGSRNTPNDAAPSLILASEQYNHIVRALEQGEPLELRIGITARYHEDDTNGYNVIAEIPGTDPDIGDEVVMVGAHLDSWHSATGATDNADASASLLEAARIMMELGVQPRRTIRIALWGGEEQGLLGSRAWVAEHLEGDGNTDAREKFSVYFNHDPGTGAIYGWYMEENAAAKPILDAWLAPLQELGARRNVMEHIGSTDHLSFIRGAGVPAFNTLQNYVDYDVRAHHTNMDFYEMLREEDLQEGAAVLAVFAFQAAMHDAMIPRVPIS